MSYGPNNQQLSRHSKHRISPPQTQNFTPQSQSTNPPDARFQHTQNFTQNLTPDFNPRVQNFTPQAQDFNPLTQNFTPQSQDFNPQVQNFIPQTQNFNPQAQNFTYKTSSLQCTRLRCTPTRHSECTRPRVSCDERMDTSSNTCIRLRTAPLRALPLQ